MIMSTAITTVDRHPINTMAATYLALSPAMMFKRYETGISLITAEAKEERASRVRAGWVRKRWSAQSRGGGKSEGEDSAGRNAEG